MWRDTPQFVLFIRMALDVYSIIEIRLRGSTVEHLVPAKCCSSKLDKKNGEDVAGMMEMSPPSGFIHTEM